MLSPAIYAKQPIFNQQLNVIGYELLFRPTETFNSVGGDQATAQVLLNTFTGDDPIIENEELAIYINCTTSWLKSGLPIDRPNVVLEVLETVKNSAELISPISQLKEQGYKIALDDFDLSLDSAKLLPISDIIKIDVLGLSKSAVMELVEALKPNRQILLAEKVESHEHYLWCKELGFDLFQGYFFSKPESKVGVVVKPPKLTTIQLLSELQTSEPIIENIVDILETDTILTTKVLKLVNSGKYVQVKRVNSVKDAVLLLGLAKLKKLIAMIALTDLTNKPHELMRLCLVIAHTMENYAEYKNIADHDEWFFIGFLSKIDAQFDQPLPIILESLPIKAEVKDSILYRKSPAGKTLSLIEKIIEADWENIPNSESTEYDIFRALLNAEQQVEEMIPS
jgi:EAL and modified HD-GYP domain-containing signal transduction protein